MDLEQPIGKALSRELDDREVVDEFTEASWKESERRAQARRARENRASWLDNEKHLRGVFYKRYLEKDRLVRRLEGKG